MDANVSFETSDLSSHPISHLYAKSKEFYPNVNAPVVSERDYTKSSLLKPSTKFEIKLDINFKNDDINSSKRYNSFEHSEHQISSRNVKMCAVDPRSSEVPTKYKIHSFGTKDDAPSTSANEGKQQNRRKRIAAQFSSPIDG